MSTISITHHPMPMAIAATAVVAAVAVGTTVMSHDPAATQAPTGDAHSGFATHHYRHFQTTSGGKVMTGN
jgi:hypothetical protein